jgi:hypothetical protein
MSQYPLDFDRLIEMKILSVSHSKRDMKSADVLRVNTVSRRNHDARRHEGASTEAINARRVTHKLNKPRVVLSGWLTADDFKFRCRFLVTGRRKCQNSRHD